MARGHHGRCCNSPTAALGLPLEQPFPKQSPSSKQHQNCFEVCRTPAGSEPDDAGSQNNLNNSKKKECWPFCHSAGTGGAGDWQEVSVRGGFVPLHLTSVPWDHRCPGRMFWSCQQQHRCGFCWEWEMPRLPSAQAQEGSVLGELCLCLSSQCQLP